MPKEYKTIEIIGNFTLTSPMVSYGHHKPRTGVVQVRQVRDAAGRVLKQFRFKFGSKSGPAVAIQKAREYVKTQN